MASSGVWENVILYKTPTFDGVCGMLSYNNFGLFFAKVFFYLLLTDDKSTVMFFMTDVIVITVYNH